MAPPPLQAMDAICTGLADFLGRWVLMRFLATCSAARSCQTHVDQARAVKQHVVQLNQFLARAVGDRALCLPGFDAGEVREAKLVPFDLHQPKFQSVLYEGYSLNPALPKLQKFLTWLLEKGFDRLDRRDVGHVVRQMNGAASAALECLCKMLQNHDASFAPSETRLPAIRRPALLFCGASNKKFYFTQPATKFTCHYILLQTCT